MAKQTDNVEHEPVVGCPIFDGQNIPESRCSDTTRRPAYNAKCAQHNCTSRLRVCRQCLLEGKPEPGLVENATEGLCTSHRDGEASTPAQPAMRSAAPAAPKALTEKGSDGPATKQASASSGAASGGALARARETLRKALRAAGEPVELDPNDIRRFAGQPRQYFDEEALAQLASSIEATGQIQSVYVRKLPESAGHAYELIDGERRWRACSHRNMPVRAIILPLDDAAADLRYIVAVAANFGKEEHTTMENARSLRYLTEELGFSVAEAAAVHAKSEPWARQHLWLFYTDDTVQGYLEAGRISMQTALAFRHYDLAFQREVIPKVLDTTSHKAREDIEELAVRHGQKKTSTSTRGRDPSDDYRNLTSVLQRFEAKIEQIRSRSSERMATMLARRSEEDAQALIRQLESLEKQVAALKRLIQDSSRRTH